MKTLSLVLLSTTLVALLNGPVRADDVKAGDLVISQPWSRATPRGAKVASGYLTIENKGSAPDRLLGGSAEVAAKLDVHEMAMNGSVMTMRTLDGGLALPPGSTLKLAPSGYHLMLSDIKHPLKQGDSIPVTLRFEKAGNVAVTFAVLGVGAMGPAGAAAPATGGVMDHGTMDHGTMDHSKMKM